VSPPQFLAAPQSPATSLIIAVNSSPRRDTPSLLHIQRHQRLAVRRMPAADCCCNSANYYVHHVRLHRLSLRHPQTVLPPQYRLCILQVTFLNWWPPSKRQCLRLGYWHFEDGDWGTWHLNIQLVPRSKHTPSRLYKPVS
jgi:hypothetical protein